MEFLEQDVMSKIRHVFHMLDTNDDGTISMTELVAAINDPLFRRGLRSIFPISLLSSATLMDGELGPEQRLGSSFFGLLPEASSSCQGSRGEGRHGSV